MCGWCVHWLQSSGYGGKHKTLTQCSINFGQPSMTSAQHLPNMGSTYSGSSSLGLCTRWLSSHYHVRVVRLLDLWLRLRSAGLLTELFFTFTAVVSEAADASDVLGSLFSVSLSSATVGFFVFWWPERDRNKFKGRVQLIQKRWKLEKR